MHEVLVNRLGGLSLPRKSVVRLTDRPDMTLDVYRESKTTTQQQQQHKHILKYFRTNCEILIHDGESLFAFVRQHALINNNSLIRKIGFEPKFDS